LALAVPLSRFTPRVGGGSAFFVRRHGYGFDRPNVTDDVECFRFHHRFAWIISRVVAHLRLSFGFVGRSNPNFLADSRPHHMYRVICAFVYRSYRYRNDLAVESLIL